MRIAALSRRAVFLLTASALLLFTGAARAEVKIVSQITMKGMPAQAQDQLPGKGPQKSTLYYKGNSLRSEIAGGPITIYQGDTDKWITLDPTKKTYTVNAAQKMLEQTKPLMAMMKIETSGDIAKGGATKTIAGYPAKNYRIRMSMTMSLREGAQGAGQGAPSGPLFTMKIEGEQWSTEAIKLSPVTQRAVTTSVLRMLGPMMQDMKPLMTKMAAIPGTPLNSRMTITFSSPQPGAPKEPMVVTTEVKSVQKTPLPATLFTVPAGYKQVEPQIPSPGGVG